MIGYIGAAALLLGNATSLLPGAGFSRLVLAVFIGPLALALSAVVLLHRAGRLSAPAAMSSAAGAIPACGFAALTAASWWVGFEEADAGLGRSWFGSSTLLFLLLAWIAGTICLVAPVESVLGNRRSAPIRLVQSTVLAAPLALILGALTLMAPLFGALGAVVLLVIALRLSSANYPSAPRDTVRVAVRSSPPLAAATVARQGPAAARAAALVTITAGLGCALFALTGSTWAPMVRDATHAMNLGLAVGALAAIPATIAAGTVLIPRFGGVIRWSALLCSASLIVVAAAQFVGAGHPLQWPLVLAAATLMGFAVALPFGRLIPGGRALRMGVTGMLGFAGSIVGLSLVTMAAFIAPLAATALFAWSLRLRNGGAAATTMTT
ncbi:hypothetical protein QK291_15660 [Arthrobacter sp. AL12]|nr:hypothetical protein [Arthrobacter sp. AL12]